MRRADLAERPCDRKLAAELADRLLQDERYEAVIELGNEFVATCDATSSYVHWKVFHSHKQLGQWETAKAVVDEFVADDPHDSDFWWWRAEVFDQLGQHAAALADYRQSLAISRNADAGAFAASRIIATARRAEDPCDGVHGLRFFVDELDGEVHPALKDESRIIHRGKDCKSRAGGRSTTVPLATLEHRPDIAVTAHGTTGRFWVEPRAGTTAITDRFATSLGLDVDGSVQLESLVGNTVRRGSLARVDRLELDGVWVVGVTVLVVPADTIEVDGVVGANVLWRFDRTLVNQRLRLRAR